jgi:hypothetical protein
VVCGCAAYGVVSERCLLYMIVLRAVCVSIVVFAEMTAVCHVCRLLACVVLSEFCYYFLLYCAVCCVLYWCVCCLFVVFYFID